MKKMNLILGVTVAAALVLTSCKKKETNESNETAVGLTSSDSDEEGFSEEILKLGSACNYDFSQISGTCVVITESSANFPKTITLDFGTGCTGPNGVTRKGKILVEMSNYLDVVGSTRTVTFDNFFVNDVQVTGTKTLVNQEINTAGNAMIKVDANLTFSKDGNTRTRVSDHMREWKGFSTCTSADDEWFITGSGTVTRNNGVSRPYTITEALHRTGTCRYFVSGEIDFGAEKTGAILNYGDGTCDEFATLTTKRRNKTYTINLATRTIE